MGKNGKYVPLQPLGRDPKNLAIEEVLDWLGGDLANTEVIRSILIAEIRAVRSGAIRETRTQRGLWYEIVKPLLSRAGELYRPKSTDGKPVDWSQQLSERLKELVDEGITSYEELRIIDGSRQRQAARNIPASLLGVNMVGGHHPEVILFTEKDTIWPIVENLATLYGVSAISGGGQPSNACTENIIRRIVRSDQYQGSYYKQILILALTDYDPHGYSIYGAQVAQIEAAVKSMDPKERGNCIVNDIRIGLDPSQLTPDEITANAYEPAKRLLDEWFEKTGGINGQPLGLELDSLSLSQLRGMFAAEIEKYIDLDKRHDDLREAFIDLMACYQLLPEFEAKRAALIKTAKNDPIWDAIKDVPLQPNLFSNAAIDGAYWISPRETLDLFEEYRERLTELWNKE